MSTPRIVPYLSRLLRQRDSLVSLIERLRHFADHKPGCRGSEALVQQCSCGYADADDTACVLLESLLTEARPAFPAAVSEAGMSDGGVD